MALETLATAVTEFAEWHQSAGETSEIGVYNRLIPVSKPGGGEQYAFEVNLDQCTGCKSCVVACHSLNGLDDEESWRDVGTLVGVKEAYLQTITTACHHCADPACANGCPVLAYDKDPLTGIVRHLDDQCIGCSYCILKCPYDVPKFNKSRGIVRKCDMCYGRLAVGEAPACVQACPNGAIAIRVVEIIRQPSAMLPGLVDSAYTQPQTRYVSKRAIPLLTAGDAGILRVEEAHTPLAVMLVLTQLAAGVSGSALWNQASFLPWLGWAAVVLGVGASLAHLGQPLKAWRAFLGWRKSWLSREIIAFGFFVSVGLGAALGYLPGWLSALAGVVSVACSIMVYADTRRAFWSLPITSGKFVGTAVLLGCVAGGFIAAGMGAGLCKLAAEGLFLASSSPSAKLMRGPLQPWTMARFGLGVLGLAMLPVNSLAALCILLVGEFCERSTFFRAVVAHRMPGV